MTSKRNIHPVILSGGSGSRLWPMSRAHFPKQLLPLAGERTMLQETALRVAVETGYQAPLVIANNEHRFIVAEQLQQAGVAPRSIILEPVGRNTAPAAAVAALILVREAPDAIMALLPSDHVVADKNGFDAAMDIALEAASDGALVTFGVQPDSPETGYGYIRRGPPLGTVAETFTVDSFVEKPDLETAQSYLASGEYLWNSGMFVFGAQIYLDQLRRTNPAMVDACEAALRDSEADLDFIRLDPGEFEKCPSDSIDYAVMERTDAAAVVPVDIGWNDVGGWPALWDISSKDENGNVVLADAMLQDVQNSYVRADDGRLVAAIGLEDMVVVSTADALVIAPRSRASDVKDIVERLKVADRKEAIHHQRVFRPWGNYNDIDEEARFRVKRIVVKPGGKLSLQKHQHRSEHWVVVQGKATVTRGEEESVLTENQSTYIPKGVVHRLENVEAEPLHLIEVQVGDYVGEDDIVRLDDTYGRAGES
ncbi:MAG: mannose-1-phosphate guanylyltransferase/mannose-6-phosphate isomerase [Rhodospirillaceae bacterium]|jgi:mannose-1-phosphate guanylyltransferase/mannose-6-phosphate isomerase|nr:mannose-1-phosphate guanylyltransferase/mannose-6-phosphate isomerase [Rhodospirillaceae bacterium]MBT5665805.1 mannose-1-phosphate guanylyltransferase/mannose-6-phosphate isomerase [Rhodospirillaceae bacterium]MBT5812503.1 mannose-1-phosphate guanylyltransferase/mannose-6-phosphate isomerase [Rhodospirillaceae bacterium]